jgi:hypothetical protein
VKLGCAGIVIRQSLSGSCSEGNRKSDFSAVLRETKPLHPPQQIMDRIGLVTQQRCTKIVNDVVSKLGPVAWANNSIEAVSRRAGRIGEIVGEVWRQN